MPVVSLPGTAHTKERLKWEYQEFRIGEEQGERVRIFEEFPKMLYKAGRDGQNQIDILERIEVGDADQQRRMESRGYVDGQVEALAAYEAQERDVAKLAANRAFHDRKMSPEAQAEARAIDEATPGHLGEIPEAPKKRGRPKRQIA
jgi:hypothetical protein